MKEISKTNKMDKCPNCGEQIGKGKSFFGFCCSDCYVGNLRGRSMESFLKLVAVVENKIGNKE